MEDVGYGKRRQEKLRVAARGAGGTVQSAELGCTAGQRPGGEIRSSGDGASRAQGAQPVYSLDHKEKVGAGHTDVRVFSQAKP